MPYTAKGKCVYRKDTGKKVGCTKGSVKKYLAALHANVKDVNESEEWYDEVLNKKPLIRFDDLMVGDVISNIDPEHEQPDTYFHVLSFEDGKTWRNAYEEAEKYVVCSLVKEDPGTGNFIPVSRTDIKFPRGKNIPMWTLVYREGVVESINESEEFNWVEIPKLPKDNDFISSVKYALEGSLYDLHLYTTGQLVNRDYHLVNLAELRKGNQTLFKKDLEYFTPENVKKEFDDVFTNIKNQEKMLGPGGMSHNPERFPDLFSKMGKVHKLYFDAYELLKDLLPKNGVNESEEFDWVENPIKYIKVGQKFSVRTSAEPLTVQIVRIVEKPDFNRNTIYFSPINLVGTKYPGVPMNVQRLLTHINSGNWTPIKKINESEDDFEWAQETIKTSFLEFNGKEILIDIRGLDTEELKRLYDIIIPYVQTNSSRFTSNEGEEISWGDNTKCFENMLTEGKGKHKSISLHCGLEDNDYLPLKGAVCCLKGTYDDEPSYSKENIIPINAREIIGDTINESEWFEDVVKDPIMLKVEELEMGDIVIPTRFNQQEYIVTGKGTSVKLLDTPTHWVTLKRNTKENTGGVFIEHDSEIGKACQFELIHREENLNESEESEESEEFEWAEDIIANTTEEIDISNDFDLWKNKLVEGSVVKITGGWEEMDFEDDIATIVNPPDGSGNHLLKFDRVIYEFGNTDEGYHTHCGENETQNIKCECQRKQKLRDEVGKCWWTNLSQMDKVIYLPFEGKQITESEEDEFNWAEDLLGFNNPINITDKLDVMEELPLGSILQVQGYQDEMELDMEEVKLIDKAEGQSYDSTYYLFKLKYEKKSDGTEMTHCGQTKHSKICECREATEEDEENGFYESQVGKCWWIELKKQDKVIYYPNRIDLTENKIKKTLLTEGRYDAITRKVVRDIMKAVTEGDSDSYNLPWDISNEQEYEQEGLSFSLELEVIRSEDVDSFEVRTAIADEDEENIIMMTIILGPRFNSQKLEKLFYKLQEDIRHEIEHFTQMGPNRIEDRPVYKGSTANLKTIYGHHKNVIEIPALVHGFYRRAKLEKRPIDEIMMDDLDAEIERGLLTKSQAQKLLTIWVDYAKKNLPAAIYKED